MDAGMSLERKNYIVHPLEVCHVAVSPDGDYDIW